MNQPADDIDKIYPTIRDINLIFHLFAKKCFFCLFVCLFFKGKDSSASDPPRKTYTAKCKGKIESLVLLKKSPSVQIIVVIVNIR